MGKQIVLVVTTAQDDTATLVEDELRRRNAEVVRLCPEKFPQELQIAVSINQSNSTAQISYLDGRVVICSDDVRSVYSRRPRAILIPPSITHRSMRYFAERECTVGLLGALSLFSVPWINYPHLIDRAENKIRQLELAASIGLQLPDTLVTNNPREAREFIDAREGDVIVKSLTPAIIRRGRLSWHAYTTELRGKELGDISDIALAPCILQTRIPKAVEIRANVVGDRVLAAEIHSQKSPLSRTDWRRFDLENTPYFPHHLDGEIEAACVKLTRMFGLTFSAIDLILTPGGDYVFLELNPNGEWGWVQELTGLPISEALADVLLIRHGLPLC
jgi:glutathione synthase/RimK-type ligase-like ATP-grasp enzyme